MSASAIVHAADGTAISYSVAGEGPSLVLSNSLATDRRMWTPQLPALQERFRVITYDTRGHGQSAVSQHEFDFETLAGDVVAILDAVHADKARFMGLSLGGMTGLALALYHPDRVERVVCCDARADAPEPYVAMWDANIARLADGGMSDVADATLPRWFSEDYRSNPDNAAGLAEIRAMMVATPAEGYAKAARCLQSLNLLKDLDGITVPVSFITGEFDPAGPVPVMQEMADRIRGARLRVVPNAAHLSNIENPDGFLEAALSALD